MLKIRCVKAIVCMSAFVQFLTACQSRSFNQSAVNAAKPVRYVLTGGVSEIPPAPSGKVNICSFNIQFLGTFVKRDNTFLAEAVKNCDVLVVQELVSHPGKYIFPDSASWQDIKPPGHVGPDRTDGDDEAKLFFAKMKEFGFSWAISTEDSGATVIHSDATGDEWYVTFFKLDKFKVAAEMPKGFLAEHRLAHEVYDRVPYALPLRFKQGGGADLVLISVHLHFTSKQKDKAHDVVKVRNQGLWTAKETPSSREVDKLLRVGELTGIYNWIQQNQKYSAVDRTSHDSPVPLSPEKTESAKPIVTKQHTERDFIILGDMNIGDDSELQPIMNILKGFRTLNPGAALKTNSQANEGYDHVFVQSTSQLKYPATMSVLNLACRAALLGAPPFEPGNPAKPAKSSEQKETQGASCAQFADPAAVEARPFFKLLKEDVNTFWSEFRYRYSDHVPVFFQVDVPDVDKD